MAASKSLLALRILWELIRFDVLLWSCGLEAVRKPVRHPVIRQDPESAEVAAVRDAFAAAAPFYWKPVRCLQRSIVIARVMRRHGIPAEVVIGYRPSPFFSHAWVEVAGRVVNDSPGYQHRLQVLERLWADTTMTA